MQIVYATRATIPHPSAASLNAMQMCEAMSSLGYDVTLAIGAKFWRSNPDAASIWKFYGIAPSFRIQRILEFPRTGLIFDHAIINECARLKAVLYSRYIRILKLAIRRRIPTILEMHSLPRQQDLQSLQELMSSPFLKGIVVLTRSLAASLSVSLRSKSPLPRILVAPDAVNPRRFESNHELAQGDGETAVGYVGSLYPGKGMEVVVPVARSLPNISFHIYGGTADQVASFQRDTIDIQNLHWHGYVAPAEAPQRFQSFQIALLPNQPEVIMAAGDDIGQYTSPMKLFEYMAASKAIVASDLPVIREVLEHDRNSLLAQPDDYGQWAALIQRLTADRTLRTRLAVEAKREAIEKYSFDQRFRRILAELGVAPVGRDLRSAG